MRSFLKYSALLAAIGLIVAPTAISQPVNPYVLTAAKIATALGFTPASATLINTHVYVGNGLNVATDVALSQDCVMANTGAITCTKTNNVAFATSATTDATNATNITSGTLPVARLSSVPSTSLSDYVAPVAWTIADQSGHSVPYNSQFAFYTKNGKQVTTNFHFTYGATADGSSAKFNLPLALINTGGSDEVIGFCVTATGFIMITAMNNSTTAYFLSSAGTQVTNTALTGSFAYCFGSYQTP